MRDIRQWLAGLGLEHFAEAFEREQLTLDNLPELTDAELKDLGLPLGPRKTILGAAANLRAGHKVASPLLPEAHEDSKLSPTRAQAQAERRQLTIMFCDLVGSTALSQNLDPEALRELMRAYQQACVPVIEQYHGHIAQYLGDGLMVYFGWPRAHEDDAERAVRAGLEIVEAVKPVSAPVLGDDSVPLNVRIGIATGSVVVGETGAGDASIPKAAVGETANHAARLQGLAGADQIVIAPTTRRLLGAAFDTVDLGEHTLKGIVEPVRAWRVQGVGQAEGRFEASHAAQLTPMLGRAAHPDQRAFAAGVEQRKQALARYRRVQARACELGKLSALAGHLIRSRAVPVEGKGKRQRQPYHTVRKRCRDETPTSLTYNSSP